MAPFALLTVFFLLIWFIVDFCTVIMIVCYRLLYFYIAHAIHILFLRYTINRSNDTAT